MQRLLVREMTNVVIRVYGAINEIFRLWNGERCYTDICG